MLIQGQNVQVDAVTDLPESSELLASWDDTILTEASANGENVENSDSTNTTSARQAGNSVAVHDSASSSGKRKRPGTSIMQQLLELHKKDASVAERAAKKARKLMKEGLRLQRESNDMQASMVQLMQQHFAKTGTS